MGAQAGEEVLGTVYVAYLRDIGKGSVVAATFIERVVKELRLDGMPDHTCRWKGPPPSLEVDLILAATDSHWDATFWRQALGGCPGLRLDLPLLRHLQHQSCPMRLRKKLLQHHHLQGQRGQPLRPALRTSFQQLRSLNLSLQQPQLNL